MKLKKTLSIKIVGEWVGILLLFSFMASIGNYVGYHYPFMDSLIGMLILCSISLLGFIIEQLIPYDIPSILYISLIGLIVAVPISPISSFVAYYTSQIELVSLTTVLLAYAGIAMGKNLGEFKTVGIRGVIVTCFVIFGTYVGSALIAQVVLTFTGMI